MKVSASVKSSYHAQETIVTTGDNVKSISIPPKADGKGSSVNGGELLTLALATCYSNDIYREAAKKNIEIKNINVTCSAEFSGEGLPGENFLYWVDIEADESEDTVCELLRHTDTVAEIHNTLRKGVEVKMVNK